ncbi:hypothetical protein TWF594_010977 [Orbilia oligospora]|nr:hypothetical protein TWF706_010478 [Orbilia oligospora]KAF3099072.1 hypothetical protein TWF103_008845 [Orbilia oligospora]KAF3129513.1 hypothetical protein TWF594_010977 [Orbilia oligospora]
MEWASNSEILPLATFTIIFVILAVGTYRILRELYLNYHDKNQVLDSRDSQAVSSLDLERYLKQEIEDVAIRHSETEPCIHTQSDDQLQFHKQLYFKLQNLERYPEILPQARDVLISLLSETLQRAARLSDGILSLKSYDREELLEFNRKEHNFVMEKWEQYLSRRRTGSPRELFATRQEAKRWLAQSAPVKYVDGAWLGHIHKITTQFAHRQITKKAWQVLSEELGDGDVEKNHVYIYHRLIKSICPDLPAGDDIEFIHPRHHTHMSEPGPWKAAIAQLLISLFPHDFLPEILGFNMHFEAVTLETLQAAKELKELKIDPYYFLLHISIDNADSGHAAMAVETVIEYIELIRARDGYAAAHEAWVRVQAGYVLSSGLPIAPASSTIDKSASPRRIFSDLEREVVRIFKSKAEVSQKIHCGSNLKLGGRAIFEWLEPSVLASEENQATLLDVLSNSKPWVYQGESQRSRFIKELSWGGKMFGSFTRNEVTTIEMWIDSLGSGDPKFYWRFINKEEAPPEITVHNRDVRIHHPVFEMVSASGHLGGITVAEYSPIPLMVDGAAEPDLARLLPLWFTHPCLLEHLVCTPAKTTTVTSSAVLRLLRVQSGFGREDIVVAGMDEFRRSSKTVDLVDLGLQMIRRSGFPEPECLRDVLDSWNSEFALLMLHLCKRPLEYESLLLGMAMAFIDLHDVVARSSSLLTDSSKRSLADIATRERENLNICFQELRDDKTRLAEFSRGYSLCRAEVENCFSRGQTLDRIENS